MSVVVIGHFPKYLRVSDKLGARDFSLSTATWNRLNPTEKWAENKRFLDRAINGQDQFVFSHPPFLARPGSWYDLELRYLRSRGIGTGGYRDVQVQW